LLDLPATIVELVGLASKSPFPGRSLSRFWSTPQQGIEEAGAISELAAPNPTDPSHGRSPARNGPLISLADDDDVYILNTKDGREQLFHSTEDPDELVDRSNDQGMRSRLEQLRARLKKILGESDSRSG
jgi:hypothetical protein